MAANTSLPIRVVNPKKLGTWEIPAERTFLGEGYKPSMALLPSGDLILASLGTRGSVAEKNYHEVTPIRRSSDGGITWSEPEIADDIIGREQWLTCTSKGILFSSSTILPFDTANTIGDNHSYLHRSTDAGKTWDRKRIWLSGDHRGGVPQNQHGGHSSRDVIELDDGALLYGVSIQSSSVAFLWRSIDDGESWDMSQRVEIGPYRGKPYDNLDGFFGEDYTYRTESGELVHYIRCGPPSPMFPMEDGRTTPAGDDGIDRTLVCVSNDDGKTWGPFMDFGDYGMHYIRTLGLGNGRVLVTYTQRSTFYPLGLKAIVSDDNGVSADFSHDLIIIDGTTPWGTASGGGFGNTIKLPDGMLVSCYSYRTLKDQICIETARWKL